MPIRDYGDYKGIPVFRDYNVADAEKVYIGNGQGCSTFWFRSVPEAKRFIDKYKDKIKVTDIGSVTGLIPPEICQTCKGHYSYQSPEWQKATRDNCQDYKEKLKMKLFPEGIDMASKTMSETEFNQKCKGDCENCPNSIKYRCPMMPQKYLEELTLMLPEDIKIQREKIKRSVVKTLKKKYEMEDVPDKEFIEWWRRNHGTGYEIEIVDG